MVDCVELNPVPTGERSVTSAVNDTGVLLQQAAQGDTHAPGTLFSRHRDRLRCMVQLRLDRRLQGRLDPSDVLQEAYLEFSRSLNHYLSNPALPFYLWLRMITGRKLHALHRRHLGAHARDAGREVSLYHGAFPPASSISLAAQLLGHYTSPSQDAMRAELYGTRSRKWHAAGPGPVKLLRFLAPAPRNRSARTPFRSGWSPYANCHDNPISGATGQVHPPRTA